MDEYYQDNVITKGLVESFDLAISNKASKTDCIEIRNQLRGIAKMSDFDEFKDVSWVKIDTLEQTANRCEALAIKIATNMPKEVNTAVRNATSKVT